jgi:hypothetical protein
MSEAILNFDSKNYTFQIGEHRTQEVIWISFPYEQNIGQTAQSKHQSALE